LQQRGGGGDRSGVNYNQEDLAANMWNGGVNFPNTDTTTSITTTTLWISSAMAPMSPAHRGAGNNATGTTGYAGSQHHGGARVEFHEQRDDGEHRPGINFAVTNGARVNQHESRAAGFDQAFSDAITTAQDGDVVWLWLRQ